MKLRERTKLFVRSADGLRRAGKKLPFTVLRRSAMEVMNYRVLRKLILIGVAIATASSSPAILSSISR